MVVGQSSADGLGNNQQVALVPIFLHYWSNDVLAAWLAVQLPDILLELLQALRGASSMLKVSVGDGSGPALAHGARRGRDDRLGVSRRTAVEPDGNRQRRRRARRGATRRHFVAASAHPSTAWSGKPEDFKCLIAASPQGSSRIADNPRPLILARVLPARA